MKQCLPFERTSNIGFIALCSRSIAILSLSVLPLFGEYTTEVVSKETDILPGFSGSESISAMRGSSDEEAPRIADDGSIFSEIRIAGATGVRVAAYAIFKPGASPAMIVRGGDAVPWVPNANFDMPSSVGLSYGRDGSLVWWNRITGLGITTSNDRIAMRSNGIVTANLLREGDTIITYSGGSSFSTTVLTPTKIWTGDKGAWAFMQNNVLYRRESEGFRRFYNLGDTAGADLTWRFADDGRMAPDGGFLSQASSRVTGTSINNETYGLIEASSNQANSILRATDLAPGLPNANLSSYAFRNFAISDEGRYAAIMSIVPSGGGFATDTLFMGQGNTSPVRVLQIGDSIPGLATGTVNNIFRLEVAGSWIATWVGVANQPGINAAVLRRRFQDSSWQLVITNNQIADDRPTFMVGAFSQIGVAENGDVALKASVLNSSSGNSASSAGVFVFRGGQLRLPIYLGLTLPDSSSVTNQLRLFTRNGTTPGNFGEGAFINASGQLALRTSLSIPNVGIRDAVLRLTPEAIVVPPLPFEWTVNNNEIVIEVPSEIGLRYRVSSSDNLGNWSPNLSTETEGTGAPLIFNIPIPSTTLPNKNFYRVETY